MAGRAHVRNTACQPNTGHVQVGVTRPTWSDLVEPCLASAEPELPESPARLGLTWPSQVSAEPLNLFIYFKN